MSDLKSKLPIIIMFLLLIIVVAYYALVFMPLQAKMEELSKEYSRVTDKIALNELNVQNMPKIQDDIDELEAEEEGYMEEFFRVGAENLPEELWALIESSGIVPDSLNVSAPYTISSSKQVNIKALEVSLSFGGDMNAAFKLLDALDNADDVYYHITEMRISKAIETIEVKKDVEDSNEENTDDSADENKIVEIETIKSSENISAYMRLLFYYPERPEA